MSEKSRNITKYEYLQVLQEEYTINDLKRRIYFSEPSKNFYANVMHNKKLKILDLAKKLELDTIFNSVTLEKEFRDKVLPKKGLPNFQMTEEDILNYFSSESEVKIWISDTENVSGVIMKSDFKRSILIVKVKGESTTRTVSCIHVNRVIW